MTTMTQADIDPGELARARQIVRTQLEQAQSPLHRYRLTRVLEALDKIDVEFGSVAVPDDLLAKMLQDGARDTWVAELLGVTRKTIADHRQRLGIRPCSRGGDPGLRTYGRAVWKAKWLPTLHRLGIAKDVS